MHHAPILAGAAPVAQPTDLATDVLGELAAGPAFALNLFRAGLIAQGAAAVATAGAKWPEPDPVGLSQTLLEAFWGAAARPERVLQSQLSLANTATDLWRSLWGLEPEGAKPCADKRFAAAEWEIPAFDALRQGYLATAKWLEETVDALGSEDPLEKRRQAFATRQLLDALCPANFLGANPAALKEALDTRAESLVRGMEHLAEDLTRGDGQLAISQTDMTRFKVGENVATAPGKVVFQNDYLQLLQFSPTTEQVHEIPLVMITPWINKYYIIDLQPGNSMIRWLTGQGHTVFVTSWINPDARHAEATFEDYMLEGVLTAIGAALEQTGAPRANTVGYCIGGTILACAMAYLAARGDRSVINSATFFAAQQDFSEAGDLLLFANDANLRDIERQMDGAGGVLPGQAMAGAFNALRANDLIWSFFVNNYLMGKEPKPFDLLFWNSDQTRMPKTMHLWYLREFYQNNRLGRGELVLNGAQIDLGQVTTPIYVQASKEDHISPFASVYRGARLFGGPATFTLAGSGHIAGVINHPDAKKYQHWVSSALPASHEDWLAGAEERPGSWWPHWGAWLEERSGDMVPARDPARGPLRPLEDAPGSYVQVRS